MTEIVDAIQRDDVVALRSFPQHELLAPLHSSVNVKVPYYSSFAEEQPVERMLGTLSGGILPIFLAVADSKYECTKYLVEEGGVHSMALVLAVGQCVYAPNPVSYSILKLLLERASERYYQGNLGTFSSFEHVYRCLWIAVKGRSTTILRMLLSYIPQPVILSRLYMGRSLTGMALARRFVEILQILIDHKLFEWGNEKDGVLLPYLRDDEIKVSAEVFMLLASHHRHELVHKPFSRKLLSAALALCRKTAGHPSMVENDFRTLQITIALSGFTNGKDTFANPIRMVGGDLQRALSRTSGYENALARVILLHGVELGRIISDPLVQNFLRSHFPGLTLFEKLWARYELSVVREAFALGIE